MKKFNKNKTIENAILKYQLKNSTIMNTYLVNQFITNNIEEQEQQEILQEIHNRINILKLQKEIEHTKNTSLLVSIDGMYYIIENQKEKKITQKQYEKMLAKKGL